MAAIASLKTTYKTNYTVNSEFLYESFAQIESFHCITSFRKFKNSHKRCMKPVIKRCIQQHLKLTALAYLFKHSSICWFIEANAVEREILQMGQCLESSSSVQVTKSPSAAPFESSAVLSKLSLNFEVDGAKPHTALFADSAGGSRTDCCCQNNASGFVGSIYICKLLKSYLSAQTWYF